jgi:hypothetical protein
MGSVARHSPEVYFESQGGWPEPDGFAWDSPNPEYHAYLDALPAGPEPQPEGPCGQAFPDDVPPPF